MSAAEEMWSSLFLPTLIDNPYENYRLAQERSPIHYDRAQRSWIVTKYDDVQFVLKNHILFSSKRPISSSPTAPGYEFILFCQDPPDHAALRSCIQKTFTTNSLQKHKPWIENLVDEMLNRAAADLDIVQALAIPLPIMVISRMLGIGDSHWADLKRWTESAVGHNDSHGQHNGRKAFLEMHGFFRKQINLKKQTPADDLLTALLESQLGDRGLSELEIINFCVTLLIAGNETTASLIGNMLSILATQPTLWDELRQHPEYVQDAVEESLRLESPIQFVSRKVGQATQLRSVDLQKDELIIACLGAANRDPDVFTNPAQFMLGRKEKHLAFSHGIHFCVGAALSRLEASIVLERMLARYSSLALRSVGSRFPNVFFRGFRSLIVSVT